MLINLFTQHFNDLRLIGFDHWSTIALKSGLYYLQKSIKILTIRNNEQCGNLVLKVLNDIEKK